MDAVLKGPQGSIELSSSIVGVGRSPANQLIVNDSEVSWLHAKICPQGQSHIVIDLGSRNGTFVNEQKLLSNTPFRLNVGDIVRFGNTTFSYMTAASPHLPTKIGAPVSLYNVESFQQQQPYAQPQWDQQSRPSSSAPPIPNSTHPQQTKKPHSLNEQKVKNKSNRKKIVGFGGLIALITALTPIILAVMHNGNVISTMPTPTPFVTQAPQIPQLHGSYSGLAINDGVKLDFNISNLVEQPDGSFKAGGTFGQCSVQIQQGKVTATDQITFQVIQQDVNCNLITGEFSGKTSSDGSNLSGQWTAENANPPQGGSWALS